MNFISWWTYLVENFTLVVMIGVPALIIALAIAEAVYNGVKHYVSSGRAELSWRVWSKIYYLPRDLLTEKETYEYKSWDGAETSVAYFIAWIIYPMAVTLLNSLPSSITVGLLVTLAVLKVAKSVCSVGYKLSDHMSDINAHKED